MKIGMISSEFSQLRTKIGMISSESSYIKNIKLIEQKLDQ